MANERTWKIGELARETGLTVRALRFYEEAGLVSPSRRTEAGHRLYSDADVRRLYRVLALRQLGLPLSEIAQALKGDASPGELIERQLAEVDARDRALRTLRARLERLRAAVALRALTAEELIETIEVMVMHEKYYTPEQMEQLAERARALGPDGMAKAEHDWGELLGEAEREHRAGTPPSDPRVQALARRWKVLIEAFTGGDPGIRASLQRMYEHEPVGHAAHGTITDPALMAYMGEAMARLDE